MDYSSTEITVHNIQSIIFIIRGKRVILDSDLAHLYGVPTKRLNEQVKRNSDRFPADFVFKLTEIEKEEVVANCDHLENIKYSAVLPNAFTEHGAIMAANVLNSKQAIEISVFVVRAFVRLREMLVQNNELALKLKELETKVAGHDEAIQALVSAIRKMMTPPEKPPRRIGFSTDE